MWTETLGHQCLSSLLLMRNFRVKTFCDRSGQMSTFNLRSTRIPLINIHKSRVTSVPKVNIFLPQYTTSLSSYNFFSKLKAWVKTITYCFTLFCILHYIIISQNSFIISIHICISYFIILKSNISKHEHLHFIVLLPSWHTYSSLWSFTQTFTLNIDIFICSFSRDKWFGKSHISFDCLSRR